MSEARILKDDAGVEWICTDVSPRRSSYVTFSCRRADEPESPPRLISVPRATNLDDPAVAAAFLAR